jgi:hypothetical protein
LVACSSEHLAHLAEAVRNRPYHDAELWFAKITQVMARHHYGISMADLSLETGLDLGQLEAGALWITEIHHTPPRSAARNPGPA